MTTSRQIAKELSTAGIKASAYARSPVTGAGFIISATPSESGREIKVFSKEETHVDVYPDKKHKQCIVNVFEAERKQSVINTGYTNQSTIASLYRAWPKTETFYAKVAKEVGVPAINIPGTKVRRSYELTTAGKKTADTMAKFKGTVEVPYYSDSSYIEHKETVTVSKTETCMLVGIDEKAHFICALPEMVYSVTAAHKQLKPDAAKGKKNVKRQGEFFFIPASKTELKQLSKTKLERDSYNDSPTHVALERSSTHFAVVAKRIGKKLFANMEIYDERSSRHDSLVLEQWHEVVRNNEIPMPQHENKAVYWD
jgi:hypothetical protein